MESTRTYQGREIERCRRDWKGRFLLVLNVVPAGKGGLNKRRGAMEIFESPPPPNFIHFLFGANRVALGPTLFPENNCSRSGAHEIPLSERNTQRLTFTHNHSARLQQYMASLIRHAIHFMPDVTNFIRSALLCAQLD